MQFVTDDLVDVVAVAVGAVTVVAAVELDAFAEGPIVVVAANDTHLDRLNHRHHSLDQCRQPNQFVVDGYCSLNKFEMRIRTDGYWTNRIRFVFELVYLS